MFRYAARRLVNSGLFSRGYASGSTADTETGRKRGSANGSRDRGQRKGSNGRGANAGAHPGQSCFAYSCLANNWIETIGWLGTAFVIGVNLENKLCRPGNTASGRTRGGPQETNACFCGKFIEQWILYATPSLLNNGVKQIVSTSDSSLPAKSPFSSDNPPKPEKSLSAIEEICVQLKNASVEYVEELSNVLGVALLESKRASEGVQCLLSTSQNCAKACFNLAVAYESGKHDTVGGQPDYSKAFEYYQMAASKGHKFAIYNLSLFYLHGKGDVGVDLTKADLLLREAAQMGVKQAQEYCHSIAKASLRSVKHKRRSDIKIVCDDPQHPREEVSLKKENEPFVLHPSASAPNLSLPLFLESLIRPQRTEEPNTASHLHLEFPTTQGLYSSNTSLPVAFVV